MWRLCFDLFLWSGNHTFLNLHGLHVHQSWRYSKCAHWHSNFTRFHQITGVLGKTWRSSEDHSWSLQLTQQRQQWVDSFDVINIQLKSIILFHLQFSGLRFTAECCRGGDHMHKPLNYTVRRNKNRGSDQNISKAWTTGSTIRLRKTPSLPSSFFLLESGFNNSLFYFLFVS